MEPRDTYDDHTVTLRPRSKEILRVKSEDLNYIPIKSEECQKGSSVDKLQNHQRLAQPQSVPDISHRHQPLTRQASSTKIHRQDLLYNPIAKHRSADYSTSLKNDKTSRGGSVVMKQLPYTKTSICAASALMTKEHMQRKHQQKLIRQSVVEESTLTYGSGTRGGIGRDQSTGGEILDRVEQLTRQLVRVCGGRRNGSVDMGVRASPQFTVTSKTSDRKKKSLRSSSVDSAKTVPKPPKRGNMALKAPNDGDKEMNIKNLDVVEAPLKAFFLRNRNHTCSLRGGKRITGAPGEEAASLAAVYTEEEKYPWGRRLEDAPWRTPIYSVKSDHRQRCTRCLTYFHFKVFSLPEPSYEDSNPGSAIHGPAPQNSRTVSQQSVKSKRAKLQKMKSLQSKWEARKGQLCHTKSAPSFRQGSIGELHGDDRLRIRQSWSQYGQHSYDSRLASAEDDETDPYTLANNPTSSNFLRPPLTEGEGLRLRQVEARHRACTSTPRDSDISEHDCSIDFNKGLNTSSSGISHTTFLEHEICETSPHGQSESERTTQFNEPISIVIGDAYPVKSNSTSVSRAHSLSDRSRSRIKTSLKPRRFLSMREHHSPDCVRSDACDSRDKYNQVNKKCTSSSDTDAVSNKFPLRDTGITEDAQFSQESHTCYTGAPSRRSADILGGPWVFTNCHPAQQNTSEGK